MNLTAEENVALAWLRQIATDAEPYANGINLNRLGTLALALPQPASAEASAWLALVAAQAPAHHIAVTCSEPDEGVLALVLPRHLRAVQTSLPIDTA